MCVCVCVCVCMQACMYVCVCSCLYACVRTLRFLDSSPNPMARAATEIGTGNGHISEINGRRKKNDESPVSAISKINLI